MRPKKITPPETPENPGAKYADLVLPELLPAGVEREAAEELLRDLQEGKGARRMSAIVSLVDLGIFPQETFFDPEPEPEPPTAGEALSQGIPREVKVATPPAPTRDHEAENYLLAGMLANPSAVEEIREILPAEDIDGEGQRAVRRAIDALADEGKGISPVVIRLRLSSDPSALRSGAPEVLEQVARINPPDLGLLREVAGHLAGMASARRDEEARKELARVALDGRMSRAKLAEAAGKILSGLDEQGGVKSSRQDSDFAFRPWPKARDEHHLYGIAGEIIRTIDPMTEADPMAILGQFLVAFGNMVGRDCCWHHESSRHGTNLFLVLAGPTAYGCKGTSLDVVEDILDGVDPTWMPNGLDGGLISGEGLIHSVRNPTDEDEGVADKRILCAEIEFGSVLTAMSRRGNTLSPQIRKAWDGKPFGLMRANCPTKSSLHHISIIGHITFGELDLKFANEEAINGFGNRFAWLCSRQSKVVPRAGKRRRFNWERSGFRDRLRESLAFAQSESGSKTGLVLCLDRKAEKLWDEESARLKRPARGILGAIRGRAAPMVMRIAMIYAILDRSSWIRVEHINAALSFWDYCEQSASFIFGETGEGNAEADALYDALVRSGPEGLTLTEMRRVVFKNHREATERMRSAIESLYRAAMIEQRTESSAANIARRWVARV